VITLVTGFLISDTDPLEHFLGRKAASMYPKAGERSLVKHALRKRGSRKRGSRRRSFQEMLRGANLRDTADPFEVGVDMDELSDTMDELSDTHPAKQWTSFPTDIDSDGHSVPSIPELSTPMTALASGIPDSRINSPGSKVIYSEVPSTTAAQNKAIGHGQPRTEFSSGYIPGYGGFGPAAVQHATKTPQELHAAYAQGWLQETANTPTIHADPPSQSQAQDLSRPKGSLPPGEGSDMSKPAPTVKIPPNSKKSRTSREREEGW